MNEETGYKWTKHDVFATCMALVAFVGGIIFSNWLIESYSEPPPGWPFPTYGPPTIVLYMPAIMFSIPLIICIILMATANRRHRAKMQGPTVYRYRDDTIVYTGDYEIHSEPDSKEPEKVYLIPTECPSCNAPISVDFVDWVGPLKAKCPQCEAIIEAKEKTY